MPRAWPIPPDIRSIAARDGRNRAVAGLAASQHGLVTTSQLLELGFSRQAIQRRVAAGRLYRIHYGVYAVGHPQLTPDGRRMAAALACGPDAAVSHRAAAAHHGFRSTAARVIDITSPSRAGRARAGFAVHSGESLIAADVAEIRGIPCTTVARTLFDLATILASGPLEYALHQAQLKPWSLDLGELAGLLDRFPGRAGTAKLRRLLGPLFADGTELKSHLERLLARVCRREKLPPPRVNAWIPLPIPAGGCEVDFSWPEQRLVVETDSRAFHNTTRSWRNGPARDRALMLAGWRVARYTWWDITEEPARVISELRALLAMHPHSQVPTRASAV